MTTKTRQMTINGVVTHEGFVILDNGNKIFTGIERKNKSEALQDAKRITL